MIIGEEIIKMYGQRIGQHATLNSIVQEANSLEAGGRLATESSIERRKQERFKVRSGAFVSINSDIDKIGPIRNISRDGIAFRYIGKEGEIYGPLEVDIFADSGFYLQKVKSQTISDFKTNGKASTSSLAIRQCSVQFCDLTDNQISLLDNFIQQYFDRRSDKDRRQFGNSNYSGPERRNGLERRISPLLN